MTIKEKYDQLRKEIADLRNTTRAQSAHTVYLAQAPPAAGQERSRRPFQQRSFQPNRGRGMADQRGADSARPFGRVAADGPPSFRPKFWKNPATGAVLCFYHYKFGQSARQCARGPCEYSKFMEDAGVNASNRQDYSGQYLPFSADYVTLNK